MRSHDVFSPRAWTTFLRLSWLLGSLAAGEEEAFQVHAMLRSAAQAAAGGAGAPLPEAGSITAACVPEAAAAAWRESFQEAVQSMLQKTKRTMQRGLSGVAKSVIQLVDSSSCGSVAALDSFKEQAARLRVLATSHGGLASLDSKVKYEPLKALSVGEVDIHAALNWLLVAWQMQKGPEEVGEALMRFLGHFSEDADEGPGAPQAEAAPAPAAPEGSPSGAKRTAGFWAGALNEALHRLGDASQPVTEDCFGADSAEVYGKGLESAFRMMMQRTRKGMQKGLKSVAAATLSLLDAVEAACERLRSSSGARRLRSGASRLTVLSSVKTLVQQGAHVEYEAMKVLKIGGLDVHLELNRLIGHWINDGKYYELGDALADFFEDFKEEEEAPEEITSAAPTSPTFSMLREAILAAQAGRRERLDLSRACFGPAVADAFAREADAAIDHMLKQRRRMMQQGLKELADATDRLFSGEHPMCVWSSGAKAIWLAAKKLGKLTRRTVVDYGTHIQYEAMKSLSVGGVAIHGELNHFLAAWKLRSREEAGAPFGELMLKLSAIRGSEEL